MIIGWSRSGPGWRTGWSREVFASTRRRPRSSTSMRGSTSSSFNVRRKAQTKLIITPSTAAYYRAVASSTTFSSLDHYMWRLTFKWARRRHRNKSRYWVVDRYFGRFHPSRRDRWVVGDHDSGAFLTKFARTGIVRHQLVKGGASRTTPRSPSTGGTAATGRRHRRWTRRVFSWRSDSRGFVLSASRR
ncbi:group II intron maturase-specific domain-containing protein [Streptomyces sp. MS1.HAVA.3]|uniref:Group II intron maturase-specific domain-containing protein n=1 Tax=Streptomyces caledonius TaxID=3134107 RepID=A0ABU8U2B4_9ACTN